MNRYLTTLLQPFVELIQIHVHSIHTYTGTNTTLVHLHMSTIQIQINQYKYIITITPIEAGYPDKKGENSRLKILKYVAIPELPNTHARAQAFPPIPERGIRVK